MAISAIEEELMRYFAQLDEPQKKSLLAMIKTFLKPGNEPAENVTIGQYNKEIEEAEAEFERGEYITHEEMLKQMKQW